MVARRNNSRKYYYDRSNAKSNKQTIFAKRTILLVIALAALAVILALLFHLFNQPEKLVMQKIDELVADYYENTFYQSVVDSEAIKSSASDKTVEDVIKRYNKFGSDKITLRQMMLYDENRHTQTFDYISHYCDMSDTYAFYRPHEPYGKTDYDVKINYSCNF